VKHSYGQNTSGGILWENSLCQDFEDEMNILFPSKKKDNR
jgi:hypothetical protein